MRKIVQGVVMSIALFGLMACASVQVSTVKSKTSYNKMWNACISSLSEVRFAASFTDKSAGLIVADQGVVAGQGATVKLNIQLFKGAGVTTVTVKFIPSPGLIGGFDIVDEYVKALKSRVPDAEVIASQ